MITIRHRRSKAVLLQWDDLSFNRADLHGKNLAGADLRGQYMPRADLSGADLRGADLRRTSLSRANLARCNAEGANFRWAQMDHTDARGATLSGADLHRSYLDFAIFDGADLRNARVPGSNNSSFRQADLRGAALKGNFSRCDFSGADLRGARFEADLLIGCSFADSDLRGVCLRGSDLERADLSGADLRGARLNGFPFRQHRSLTFAVTFVMLFTTLLKDFVSIPASYASLGSTIMTATFVIAGLGSLITLLPAAANLVNANLREARYDGTTRWPRGFDPVAQGAALENGDADPLPAGH